MTPLSNTDAYKLSHAGFMNKATQQIYSNLTARSSTYAPVLPTYDKKVVVWGLQGWQQEYLVDTWNNDFFNSPKREAISRFTRRVNNALGEGSVDYKHFEDLHDLGYLPIEMRSLPEGSRCPIGVPMATIVNTHDDYAWLTNYLETVWSCDVWKPITVATIAYEYKKLMNAFADKTCDNRDHVQFQCHDFSFRGMAGRHDAARSGSGHLLSFVGTDTIPAIDYLEEYYYADSDEELVGCSVPASEHSVTSLGSAVEGEFETIQRWITKDYPKGIVSIVSDTYDFWKVLTEYMPRLKTYVMARDGKVVIRPDSGDPADIVCGTELRGYAIKDRDALSPEAKGAIELLWETFGGTINDKGYKVLDPHIGLIYGDSITLERADDILNRLEAKGFAASNVVFGVGSFTYQYLTRDTFGMAVKATAAIVDNKHLQLFKDPVTDNGVKKSAKGYLQVYKGDPQVDADYYLIDQCETFDAGELRIVFLNGKVRTEQTLAQVRERLDAS
jgi:nicotinamide phosphoribosyltransferase